MKIHVKSRSFFENIASADTEQSILAAYRIILIASTAGSGRAPLFSSQALVSPDLLCLEFDDAGQTQNNHICNPLQCRHAKQILRFVGNGKKPLLIDGSPGNFCAEAIGEILNWYFNFYLEDSEEDFNLFYFNHRQIVPNVTVCRALLRELGLTDEYQKSGR